MSATISGALKAHLERQGWGVPWFRDGAPPETKAPFGTIQEGIAVADDRHGDFADPQADGGETEQVQVDLYQPARKLSGGRAGTAPSAENYQLIRQLRAILHGWRGSYGTPPMTVYGARVVSWVRWPIADNLVRHTVTVEVRRSA